MNDKMGIMNFFFFFLDVNISYILHIHKFVIIKFRSYYKLTGKL